MEELFQKIAIDFSGKVFTKEDLMKKYYQKNISYDKFKQFGHRLNQFEL